MSTLQSSIDLRISSQQLIAFRVTIFFGITQWNSYSSEACEKLGLLKDKRKYLIALLTLKWMITVLNNNRSFQIMQISMYIFWLFIQELRFTKKKTHEIMCSM